MQHSTATIHAPNRVLSQVDVTATEMLTQLAQELNRRGVRLVIAHGIGQVRDILRQAGADAAVLQSMYATVDEAVHSFADRSGPSSTV